MAQHWLAAYTQDRYLGICQYHRSIDSAPHMWPNRRCLKETTFEKGFSMTKMKNNRLCPGLYSIVLAIIFSGCQHKISPVAATNQALPEASPSPAASLLVGDRATPDPGWSDLNAAMEKMHTAAASVERSGNTDVDFVSLMLPHHQAALDMAKAQLLHGKDPQMRRLAQEIITDQQSEIELMQLWLKQHRPQK
jgi:hypothetical protein